MSIRNALIGTLLALVTISMLLTGALGVLTISRNILRETQERVDRNAATLAAYYDDRRDALGRQLESEMGKFSSRRDLLEMQIQDLKHDLGLAILNECSADGTPLIGDFPDRRAKIPVTDDPVLRRALEGKMSWGTVSLTGERILLEGGPELLNTVTGGAEALSGEKNHAALFWWFAKPVFDEERRVSAIIYGGRCLNFDNGIVDDSRALLFGDGVYEGKPIGTVTLFLDDVRIATNVVDGEGKRAVGTRAAAEIREKVLIQGQAWKDRASVVGSWYVSCYRPLSDPDGRHIGMLYVGLLEAPYAALRQKLVLNYAAPVIGVGLLSVVLGLWLVRRITRPLRSVSRAAKRLAQDTSHAPITQEPTYTEVRGLVGAFNEMQAAIDERDRKLRAQNSTLNETNEQLHKVNRNYMEMVGFVSHEIKSPIAAIQSMVTAMLSGFSGQLPEKAAHFMVRIRRNCEELQDMVKNYLDLSRVERGELIAKTIPIDLKKDVVDPSVEQTAALFESRGIQIGVECPDGLNTIADPELLRIALTNYLTNAAKYGAEGGRADVSVRVSGDEINVSVRNEGLGFSAEEKEKLFGKFARLNNATTRNKRGSGVGLFLTKQILDLHRGEVFAESDPGHWAEFGFRLPTRELKSTNI